MKIDLHVHTNHSFDASGSPEEVLEHAKKIGLDGIAITEHNSYHKTEIFLSMASQYNLHVFAGAEVPTLNGHYLVFSEDVGRWNSYSHALYNAQDLINKVNEVGGVVICAHPYRFGLGYGGRAVKNMLGLTAIEVYNGGNRNGENKNALELAEEMNLPGIGGSDAHRIEEIGRCYTEFSVPVSNLSDLIHALKHGYSKPVIAF